MPAPTAIIDLVRRFHEHHGVYTSGSYNETQLRREFLDPFFEALGWDVFNRQGFAEAYKDVIHEDAIKVGAFTKAPDYCFRVGGTRKFFVEAKKPSVNVKDDLTPAFQVRRYAWSAKLPLSILTDFEEFAVYDCRVKPDKNDKASTARIMYLTYTELEKRWDEIVAIFSKDAIQKGSFDKYAQGNKGKKGTAEVDAAFLEEIEGWREVLARNIALRNGQLSQRELNFAVQQTIDRIIFLRICEDRGMEAEGRLAATTNGANVYKRLCELFRLADNKYNSGLFHFRKEQERDLPDEMTLGLEIDDKPFKDIIKGLYYPDCPYEFSVISSDILGQVYEQFLGKVIRLTDGHRAVVEDKPEVKKAGGVFYTPNYIADYIVKNTVGKLLGVQGSGVGVVGARSSRPKAVERVQADAERAQQNFSQSKMTPREAALLRIIDISCGSGSFLITAYQYLLDWHLAWYVANNPQKYASGKNPELYQSHSGDWKLTLAERKRILLNNIYGVDIDPQAVEVTKLSLLLKVLEGESEQSVSGMQKLVHTRVLPDLDRNIKCGNSLIGPDFHTAGAKQALPMKFDNEESLRINAFDWKAEFPDIMKSGGFDAVIGNPPYIRIQALKEWAPVEVEIYKQQYASAKAGNYDIYVVFVEKGLSILNSRGRLGYILPHKFFNSQYGTGLRGQIGQGKHLSQVVHFGDKQVFKGATTYTCLLFLDKAGHDKFDFIKVNDLTTWCDTHSATTAKIHADSVNSTEWNFTVGVESGLVKKLNEAFVQLGVIADRMAQGIRTSANEVYVLDLISEQDGLVQCKSKQLDRIITLERKLLLPFLQGREIKSYRIMHSGKMVIIPYGYENNKVQLISEKELKQHYPFTYEYLRENKAYLEMREKNKMRGPNWYGYVYPKNIELMSLPKLLVPDIADRAAFAYDVTGRYAFTSGYGVIFKNTIQENPAYFLGLLNSKVLDFFLKQISTTMRGGFFRYFTQYIEQLPIRTIDFSDRADKARHDRMVEMVEQMLALNKQLAITNTAHEKTALQRQIDATDHQIDQLVYELYGLTDEEIKIVENKAE